MIISSIIYSRSSVSRTTSFAFSAIPFATVRIVPSLGFITALYAVSTARSHAFAKTTASIVSKALISFVNPLKSCERITPELPRAPLKEPEEIALANVSIVGLSIPLTSFAADIIVNVIFVPVSPSGTGNTFNSLIHSFFASRFLAPAKNIFCKVFPSILVTTIKILLKISLLHVRLLQRY